MPTFTIRTTDSTFFTETVVDNLADADAAHNLGVRGALEISADEIREGGATAVVELSIGDANGRLMKRSVVSISVAPLVVGQVEQRDSPAEANDS